MYLPIIVALRYKNITPPTSMLYLDHYPLPNGIPFTSWTHFTYALILYIIVIFFLIAYFVCSVYTEVLSYDNCMWEFVMQAVRGITPRRYMTAHFDEEDC